MKQRPRPTLACSTCNNIYCNVCLETRYETDRYAAGLADGNAWECPKCQGDCPCKACSKGAPRKRSAPRAASAASSSSAEHHFDVPAPRSAPKRATTASTMLLPGRQPSVPAGLELAPAKKPVPNYEQRERMGLGELLMDVNTPLHRKALELARERDRCNENITNMKNLVHMLEQERAVLDQALNSLIKETTAHLTSSKQGMQRTPSLATFEELLAPGAFSPMKPSSSNPQLFDEHVM